MTAGTEQHRAYDDAEDEEVDGRRRRRMPRPSTVALALASALGALLLLWGLDRVAHWGAETLLQRQIEDATGVGDVDVQVHGTLFLPQVVSGSYDDVEVTVTGLRAGPLRIERVHAELHGVHLSFHDLLLRDVNAVVVDHSSEQALLTYDDLNAYLKATNRPVRAAPAPGDTTKLTGSVSVLGHDVSASARARLGVRDGSLTVQPTGLATDTVLDRASELLLGQRFTFVVPLDPLPFGQELTSVHAGDRGFTVAAGGTAVVIRP
jgi:LmeA-like phospholipid-binding